MIPYGKQSIDSIDIKSVVDVLESDMLTQGPMVPKFEELLSEKFGSKYATVFNSATSALHAACLSMGIGKGDSVWTSPISFVASANCVLYTGAKVDFVDIDYNTVNIDSSALERKLEKAKALDELPKAIIAVHFSGFPCNLEEISRICKIYNVKLIEDASHAIGATYKNSLIGSCTYSDITIFSFHPVKIITTGEGGAAMTNDQFLDENLKLLRSHGITKDRSKFCNPSGDEGGWNYQQLLLGYNYRMTDIQAALGISQLSKLNKFIDRRNKICEWYNNNLKDLPVSLPASADDRQSSNHLYVIKLDKTDRSRLDVYNFLVKSGVGVNVHYIPIVNQPYYKNMGFFPHDYPNAQSYYKVALTLPIFPDISEPELQYVIEKLWESLR